MQFMVLVTTVQSIYRLINQLTCFHFQDYRQSRIPAPPLQLHVHPLEPWHLHAIPVPNLSYNRLASQFVCPVLRLSDSHLPTDFPSLRQLMTPVLTEVLKLNTINHNMTQDCSVTGCRVWTCGLMATEPLIHHKSAS